MSIKVVRSPKPTIFHVSKDGFVVDEDGKVFSKTDLAELKEACDKSLTNSKVDRLLTDPDEVAHYGELLHNLTREEAIEMWEAVQDKDLLEWAWRERNKGYCDIPEPTSAPPLKGFVYLCRNNRNSLIKIGFSRNPKYREATLQSEEPDVEFIYVTPGTWADEQRLHRSFGAFRVRGEWFRLSGDHIDWIKTQL